MGNHDPAIAAANDVDRGVYRPRRGDELQIGQALDDVARYGVRSRITQMMSKEASADHGICIVQVI